MSTHAGRAPEGRGGPDGMVWRARAPAKVNLTLHVLGRRPDGYHELDSLVAFAGACDDLAFEPGGPWSLSVSGPTGVESGAPSDNLVLRAARALAERRPGVPSGSFRLVKRLPVAAGLGGGSSDAAAARRLLANAAGLPAGDPALAEAARATGADVAVCLAPRARRMQGLGERVGPPLGLPPLFAVLANPRVATPTPAVFRALGLEPGQALRAGPGDDAPPPLERGTLLAWLEARRNDLEEPALTVAPAIRETLDALRTAPGSLLARMSGSGATCFALFADCHAAARAARTLRAAHPFWWVTPTLLR